MKWGGGGAMRTPNIMAFYTYKYATVMTQFYKWVHNSMVPDFDLHFYFSWMGDSWVIVWRFSSQPLKWKISSIHQYCSILVSWGFGLLGIKDFFLSCFSRNCVNNDPLPRPAFSLREKGSTSMTFISSCFYWSIILWVPRTKWSTV